MSIERRAHPRHELEISVQFRGDGTHATTRDVSRGGCAILAPRMRLVNERLALTLTHPASAAPLEVSADVKRSVGLPDGRWLLGVQFVDLNEALQKKVVAFVEAVTAARAASASAQPPKKTPEGAPHQSPSDKIFPPGANPLSTPASKPSPAKDPRMLLLGGAVAIVILWILVRLFL